MRPPMTMAPATTSSPAAAFTRALAFERAMRVASGLTQPIPGGLLVADGAHPLVWDVNTLWIDEPAAATAAELVDEARVRQGALGLLHRSVVVQDEAAWRRMWPGFARAGYTRDVHAVMRHAGPVPPPPGHEVVEGPGRAALEAAVTAYVMAEPFGADPEAARQVVAHVLRTPAEARERWFAVVRDGAVAAYARLWEADGVAQVEDVVTLAPWRRQGLARAVVTAATRAALAAGPELLFIVADDEDWPKDLYASLGYATVGRIALFRQVPAAD